MRETATGKGDGRGRRCTVTNTMEGETQRMESVIMMIAALFCGTSIYRYIVIFVFSTL